VAVALDGGARRLLSFFGPMLSLRAHVLICAALLAALVGLAAAGAALEASGALGHPEAFKLPVLVLFVALFLGFGFSTVPVMVKLVLGFQRRIGNQDVALVKAALARESRIIWAMWGVMAAGMAVALPAAFLGGAFGPEVAAGCAPGPGRSQGLLVAAPGMTLAELVRGSTVKIDLGGRKPPIHTVAGDGVFDFQVPGSGLRFERCRYYFLSTDSRDHDRIEGMSIGVSPAKLTRAEIDAADAALTARLAADGWLAGHEVYRTEEDRQLHGGKTEGPPGWIWLKDGVLLRVERRRMDEAVRGEDLATAGEWIQFVELRRRDGYSGIERLVFEPWSAPVRTDARDR